MKTEWDIPNPTGGAEGNTGESGQEGRWVKCYVHTVGHLVAARSSEGNVDGLQNKQTTAQNNKNPTQSRMKKNEK